MTLLTAENFQGSQRQRAAIHNFTPTGADRAEWRLPVEQLSEELKGKAYKVCGRQASLPNILE